MLEQLKEQQQKQQKHQQQELKPHDLAPQIWRRKLSYNLFSSFSSNNHICNIEDTFFINQKSLRDPQNEDQSFLKTIFYFKSVSNVSVSKNYITLHLKKRYQNYLPKQYFIERFKSFGNKQFYEFAVHLERIAQHINQIKSLNANQQIRCNFTKEKQEQILNQSLKKLQKKKFFSFFYEFTQQGSSLNQIIISKALLIALGYDYEDIVIGFLKYQQAIFEIISAKLYYLVMQRKSQLLDSIFQKMKQQILSPQQIKQITMFRFNDDLLENSNSINQYYQRKIRSRIKFHKAHPSVTIFEVQKMNRKCKFQYQPLKNRNNKLKIKNRKNQIKKQQFNCIKNILKISENQLYENQQKMSTYKLINPEKQIKINNNKKIIAESQDSQYLGFD